MLYYGRFQASQLKWLQKQQEHVDREIARFESSPSATAGDGQRCSDPNSEHFDPHFAVKLQGLLDQMAATQRIPLAAVPNVKACWDAERCRLGKGISINYFRHVSFL